MTATWIVGVDGSENSLHALEWAIDQAVGRAVRLVLLSTWSPPLTAAGRFPEAAPLYDWHEFEQSLLEKTRALASERTRDGVQLEAVVSQGPAAQALIDASHEAELVIVGARGLGRVKGLVLGSVSQRCASHGVVPTAIIGPDAPLGPARTAVIGFDGSPNARGALEWALRFVDDAATITVVDALAVAPWLQDDVVRARFAKEVEAAEREFGAHMAALDPTNRAGHSFVIGDARVKLADVTRDADLLVLGARGRGRVGALLLGSTTTWMLHNATCATVVVPSHPAA
ncbi:MAG: universal stress protein [Ilumatobacteraceae bacterium]